MNLWLLNALALFLGTALVTFLALGLLWRLGSWRVSPAASLTLSEGLRIGSPAPQLAAHAGDNEFHLSFSGRLTFLVFGSRGCEPCKQLLAAASSHPATRPMRRVYVSDSEAVDADPDALVGWETFRFHHEKSARQTWRAPVSPYFHVIAADGHIVEKGVANKPEHLDRLLSLLPQGASVRPADREFYKGGDELDGVSR